MRDAMTKYRLEYIWLDGYTPTPNLRGKTQIKEFEAFPKLEQLPLWGFDGSSTMQAEGHSSDCLLKPVAVYPDAARTNGVLVMCEVMMPDGKTPHPSNKRATILDDEGAWFGFEQEYFFYKDGRPLGFPESGYPAPQGPYYTGVGYKNVGDVARKIVEEHLDQCLAAGINHDGINAYFEALMAQFDKNLMDHIAVYGPDNDKRLTGKHETAPWNKFSYGVADRGASIRVPHSFVRNGYRGYLEDRRPNSQGDPYQIASQVLKTIASVSTDAKV